MPGKINGQNVALVAYEIARGKNPDRMILTGAVNEHYRRQVRIELAVSGCRVRALFIDREIQYSTFHSLPPRVLLDFLR